MRLALAFTLLALTATHAVAQQDTTLDRAMSRLVRQWAEGDAAGLAARASSGGLSIELDGRPSGPLHTRQAAAALRRLFDQRETMSISRGMSGEVAGDASSAFIEFDWVVRMRGTTIPEHVTVFIALKRQDVAWRVTEIRVLR
ncbi:MAG TPA: hypothetical protein VJ957_11725 [Longimicrobiales bacterium]|nr:hypothetical protein [Longimicrobiales bacterium]